MKSNVPLILALGTLILPIHLAAMTFEEELAEFRSIGNTYLTAWDKATAEPETFVAIVRDYPAKATWFKARLAAHRADVDAKNDKGKLVAGAAKGAVTGINQFMSLAGDFAGSFAADFAGHLGSARSDAARAEAERTPGHLQSAQRHLDSAEWMVTVLVAFNGDADVNARQCGEEISRLREEFAKKEAALRKATARVVTAPVETYRGNDREAMRRAIAEAWKSQHPGDEILEVVFDRESWKINRFSRWHDVDAKWDHIDKSFLELSVVVKKDARTASICAAFVNRDNRTGAVTYGVDTKGSAFVVDELPISEL